MNTKGFRIFRGAIGLVALCFMFAAKDHWLAAGVFFLLWHHNLERHS